MQGQKDVGDRERHRKRERGAETEKEDRGQMTKGMCMATQLILVPEWEERHWHQTCGSIC